MCELKLLMKYEFSYAGRVAENSQYISSAPAGFAQYLGPSLELANQLEVNMVHHVGWDEWDSSQGL
jgi:hypothetical protein